MRCPEKRLCERRLNKGEKEEMRDFSILIGGKAGSGIDKSTLILGDLLNQSGYRVYIYRDYPSLIREGIPFLSLGLRKQK